MNAELQDKLLWNVAVPVVVTIITGIVTFTSRRAFRFGIRSLELSALTRTRRALAELRHLEKDRTLLIGRMVYEGTYAILMHVSVVAVAALYLYGASSINQRLIDGEELEIAAFKILSGMLVGMATGLFFTSLSNLWRGVRILSQPEEVRARLERRLEKLEAREQRLGA
jgi:hypothetical protein